MQLFSGVPGDPACGNGETGVEDARLESTQEANSGEVSSGVMVTSSSEGMAHASIQNVAVGVMRVGDGIEPWKKTEDRKRASKAQLLKLVRDQRFQCVTCGVKLTPETSEIDHIVPRADGGGNDVHNLQWLCVMCNRAKGTMRHGQFLELCERVARHNAYPG